MSTLLLLPGFGGSVEETVVLGGAGSVDSNIYDCSRCATLAVQLKTTTGNPATVQLQQSFDGVNWRDFGNVLATAGDLSTTDQLVGKVKVVLSSNGAATVVVKFIGAPVPINW